MDNKRSKKNRGLDGLRGITILVVLLALLIPDIFKSGDLALQMFSVVIGYITTVTASGMMRKNKYKITDFYIKRLKNYYPEIITLFLTFCGLAVIFAHSYTRQVGKNVLNSILGLTLFFLVFPLLFYIWNMIADKNGPTAANIFLVIVEAVVTIVIIVVNKPAINIYPFIVGMIAALVYKKKLKYESLPKDYRRNRLIMFLIASLVTLLGIIFINGNGDLEQILTAVIGAAMGVMVWLATASYLKIGSTVDIVIFKTAGKMWLEFLMTYTAMTSIFGAKGWTGLGARCILVILIPAITFVIYKTIHFLNVEMIKDRLSGVGNESDSSKKLLMIAPLFVLTVLILLGFIGLIVFGKSKDTEEKKPTTTTEATVAKTTELTTAEKTTEATTTEAAKPADSAKVTIVGDFMLQGITYDLPDKMPNVYIDASQNRQVVYSDSVINDLKEAGNLRDIVVLILGTNGDFSEEDGQAVLDAIGKERKIYWVNTYGTSLPQIDDVNKTIDTLAGKNSNLTVIDWNGLVKNHPEYVGDGGPFLTGEGIDALVELIYNSVH
ncbi:MAG: hypothetical protein K6C35_02775 [Eubacterium sp.]|nr:hypothetical protein [Eubacterium sp.]